MKHLARPGGATLPALGPLDWLTARQRAELRRQVRGGQAMPDRLPLARLQGVAMIDGRIAMLPQIGLAVAFVGFWIMNPAWHRAVAALFLAAAVTAGALYQRRDERRARRFLDEHPDPRGS